MAAKEKEFGVDLLLDVNTAYDWNVDVDNDGMEYSNPVHAANKLITLSNSLVRVTQGIAKIQKELAEKNASYRTLENAVAVIEQSILREKPPAATKVKTIKMQAAYIDEQAVFLGLDEKLSQGRTRMRQLEDEIDLLELRLKTARAWVEAIKLCGEHIKTFLAFRKYEHASSSYGT